MASRVGQLQDDDAHNDTLSSFSYAPRPDDKPKDESSKGQSTQTAANPDDSGIDVSMDEPRASKLDFPLTYTFELLNDCSNVERTGKSVSRPDSQAKQSVNIFAQASNALAARRSCSEDCSPDAPSQIHQQDHSKSDVSASSSPPGRQV